MPAIRVNELKARVTEIVEGTRIGDAADSLAEDSVDIFLPGVRRPIGAEHPVIKTRNEIVSVFQRLGYSVADGPVVETDYYNFEALNFPPKSSSEGYARHVVHRRAAIEAAAGAFVAAHAYVSGTDPDDGDMRPPIHIVIPGTVHRNDPPDASHSPMFHQIEGLAVDTNITFGDLKGTLDHAMKARFGSSVKTHFRPSFLPFTGTGAELYVTCFICGGSGKTWPRPCRPCKATGWIEVLGCGDGQIRRVEFRERQRIRSEEFPDLHLGIGVDRLSSLKYGVDDVQCFSGRVRFLQQIGSTRSF